VPNLICVTLQSISDGFCGGKEVLWSHAKNNQPKWENAVRARITADASASAPPAT